MFSTCELPGVVLHTPAPVRDRRGFFKEISRADACARNGMPRAFVQVNMSHSTRGVLRGLHYQLRRPQGKLISVAHGEILDVLLDCRRSSLAFGKWMSVKLSAERGEEIYIPEGFAHGFRVLSESAAVVYQCTDYYQPGDEYGVNFASAALGVDWGLGGAAPVMSDKDAALPDFSAIPARCLPE